MTLHSHKNFTKCIIALIFLFFRNTMLGHGRISFETPNVIDPGDDVPLAPERSLQKDFENRGSSGRTPISPPEESRRGVYKPSLSRTIKINYQDNADEEPTDLLMPVDLDPEFGEFKDEPVNASGSPTMVQTRLFAAAMLSESESRGSNRFIGTRSPVRNLFGRKKQREEEYLRHNLGLEYPMDKWQKDRRRRLRCAIFLFATVIALFTVLGVSMWLHSEDVPTSDRLEATYEFLKENKISSEEDLSDVNSSQYKAAKWIANEDEEYIDIPVDPFRFIQRYVAAVLYFAMGGENWASSLRFLSSDHECSWNELIPDENDEIFAVGISCDQNLNINSLLIRKSSFWVVASKWY
jgi:hypothetical protein